jgi:hypothetical protein
VLLIYYASRLKRQLHVIIKFSSEAMFYLYECTQRKCLPRRSWLPSMTQLKWAHILKNNIFWDTTFRRNVLPPSCRAKGSHGISKTSAFREKWTGILSGVHVHYGHTTAPMLIFVFLFRRCSHVCVGRLATKPFHRSAFLQLLRLDFLSCSRSSSSEFSFLFHVQTLLLE